MPEEDCSASDQEGDETARPPPKKTLEQVPHI